MAGMAVVLLYLAGMIFIGVFFFKKSDNLSDYFIGGRRLNSWVGAFSVFSSDMSGWLMLGFVGAIYAYGTGEAWIAAGLVLGSILNWLLVAKRLRRYSLTAQYSITIPEFFENRFRDYTHTLKLISSLFIILFFSVYTAAGFVACGTLFSQIFGVSYRTALLAAAAAIFAYTVLGGFRAVCWTDFFQALLTLVTIISVPLVILVAGNGFSKIFSELPPDFLDPFKDLNGGPVPANKVVSGLTWGLGYFGMPHILIRFMAIKNEKALSRAAFIAVIAVIAALGFAAFMGLAAAALSPGISSPSLIFVLTIQKIFAYPGALLPLSILGGIFYCGILAAIMSTVDSQLILCASVLTSDIYHGILKRQGKDKYFLMFSRVAVAAVSVAAYIIARDQSSTLALLVSHAWSGFGSVFGALIPLSLYWKRLTRQGALAGICSGGLVVLVWDHIPLVLRGGAWMNPGEATGIYSLAPGFCVSLFCIVAVSLVTKPPSGEILDEFEIAATKPIFEE